MDSDKQCAVSAEQDEAASDVSVEADCLTEQCADSQEQCEDVEEQCADSEEQCERCQGIGEGDAVSRGPAHRPSLADFGEESDHERETVEEPSRRKARRTQRS